MIRLIVSVASRVWSVESTRWPVSAARERGPHRLLVAHLADQDHVGVLAQDAAHRLGEALGVRADLALVDDRVLVAVQVLDRVLDRDDVPRPGCELMWSIIAASVVDLPEPVVPVSRMIPRGSSASRRTTSGRPSSSIVRTSKGIARQTIEIEPRWRKALTRKRETPGIA